MLYDIVEVKVVKDHRLYLCFKNDVVGEVDLSKIIPFEGIFTQLKDVTYFATVRVDSELETIVWDNGADLSPDYLYSIISSKVS